MSSTHIFHTTKMDTKTNKASTTTTAKLNGPRTTIEGESLPPFIGHLWSMLNDQNKSIHWDTQGTGFIIQDIEHFEAYVLPKYYKHSNFSSFVRQLNMYKFKKVTDSKQHINHWRHDALRRGDVHCLAYITRRPTKQAVPEKYQSNRTVYDSDDEQSSMDSRVSTTSSSQSITAGVKEHHSSFASPSKKLKKSKSTPSRRVPTEGAQHSSEDDSTILNAMQIEDMDAIMNAGEHSSRESFSRTESFPHDDNRSSQELISPAFVQGDLEHVRQINKYQEARIQELEQERWNLQTQLNQVNLDSNVQHKLEQQMQCMTSLLSVMLAQVDPKYMSALKSYYPSAMQNTSSNSFSSSQSWPRLESASMMPSFGSPTPCLALMPPAETDPANSSNDRFLSSLVPSTPISSYAFPRNSLPSSSPSFPPSSVASDALQSSFSFKPFSDGVDASSSLWNSESAQPSPDTFEWPVQNSSLGRQDSLPPSFATSYLNGSPTAAPSFYKMDFPESTPSTSNLSSMLVSTPRVSEMTEDTVFSWNAPRSFLKRELSNSSLSAYDDETAQPPSPPSSSPPFQRRKLTHASTLPYAASSLSAVDINPDCQPHDVMNSLSAAQPQNNLETFLAASILLEQVIQNASYLVKRSNSVTAMT